MLQQTQVARVVESFARFIERFPTLESLAQADIDDVLEYWSGLGYYRRARHLHEAAQRVCHEYGSSVPSDRDKLLRLPGIGRYTAGAVSSIAFNKRSAIVDGNVFRVLCRLCGDAWATDDKEAIMATWDRARCYVDAAQKPAIANEALMELGATVCTKAAPKCSDCPVRSRCIARAQGSPESIPLPKSVTARVRLVHQVVIVRDVENRILLEQRSAQGVWANLWQPIGYDGSKRLTKAALGTELGLSVGRQLERFTHLFTHREVRVEVYSGTLNDTTPMRGQFIEIQKLKERGLSSVHARILERYCSAASC